MSGVSSRGRKRTQRTRYHVGSSDRKRGSDDGFD